ncbi:MAG: sulfatase-like hydrolase/transferase [Prevotella sp.]|jgi:arylsulfatase|nr:sulfatase-like hydrolase/transferase [Prevotella sp.]
MKIKHISPYAGCLLPLIGGQLHAQENKPNIVLILVDDLGWSDFGCYGSEIRTPAIDSLAQNGLRYRQFYNAARSSPSRCALLTGLYTQQVAVNPGGSLPNCRTDNNITIAELLKGNGYRTYMAGKWHLGNADVKRDPVSRGFQHVFGMIENSEEVPNTKFWDISFHNLTSQNNEISWDDYAGRRFHQTDAIGDYSVRFINHSNSKGDNNPFFLYMAFNAPHFPISGPAEIADKYTDVADSNPGDNDFYRYEVGWDSTRTYRFERQKELGVINEHYTLSPRSDAMNPANTPIPAWNTLNNLRKNDLARRMAVYAAAITQIDDNIKKVVDALRANNQLENTLILIMSDNGGNHEGHLYGNPTARQPEDLYTMGQANDPSSFPRMNLGTGWANVANTPFRLYKHFAHEGGIRTPGIIFYPAQITRPGSWVEQPAHLIDVMATIVDVTGSAYPARFNSHAVLPLEGQSLKPQFTGGSISERSLFVEHESNRAIYVGDYKLVTKNFALSDGSSPAHHLELYNIKTDPCELHNIASEQPEKLREMVAKWNETATRIGVPADRLISSPASGATELIFRYSFDDNLTDASPNSYTLSAGTGNGSTVSTTVVKYDEGKFGKAILLDGQNDYYDLNVSNTLNPAEEALTACAWVYNTQTAAQRDYTTTPIGIDEEQVIQFLGSSGGRVILQHIINDTMSNIATKLPSVQYKSPEMNCFSLNQWQHIGVVSNPASKTMTFFLNGRQLGEPVAITTDYISASGGYRIGAHRTGVSSFWHGRLDEVCLFRGALTPEQIVSVMNNDFDFPNALPNTRGALLRVFPNPARNVLSVSGTAAGQEIRITDINGRVQGVFPAEQATTCINISQWSNGTYFVGIGGQTVKVIKM